MNAASEKRLGQVHPELAKRIRILAERLLVLGITIQVTQGLRTIQEQDALYAQGRRPLAEVNRMRKAVGWAPIVLKENEDIVTKAAGGYSNHNFGLAVDVAPFINGKPQWKAPKSVWLTIGVKGEELGLEWGGQWQGKFLDLPHLEVPGITVPQCRSCFTKGGLEAVWREASKRLVA